MNQIPNIEKTLETYFPDDLRMRAYYYGFKSTGIRDIDKILSAVAIAGKSFHSTDQWIDEMYEGGVTAEKLIQYAADTAALHIHQQLQKAREEALAREKQLKQVHMMELDAISCMSLEQYVVWCDQRKQRPNHSELDHLPDRPLNSERE